MADAPLRADYLEIHNRLDTLALSPRSLNRLNRLSLSKIQAALAFNPLPHPPSPQKQNEQDLARFLDPQLWPVRAQAKVRM
jgi:hypothetical protein